MSTDLTKLLVRAQMVYEAHQVLICVKYICAQRIIKHILLVSSAVKALMVIKTHKGQTHHIQTTQFLTCEDKLKKK